MWTQRDQFTCTQLPLADEELIRLQHDKRVQNHPYSEKSKAPRGKTLLPTSIEVGDLVYLHVDRNKSCSRDRYLVVSVEGLWCGLRKFAGSQLRDVTYRVKTSDCYKVPATCPDASRVFSSDDASDDDDMMASAMPQVVFPQIPPPPAIPPRNSISAHSNGSTPLLHSPIL